MEPKTPFCDPLLRDLRLALNSDWIEAQVRRWLESGDAPFVVEQCRLERFRYRPGKRLVCLYGVQLRDPLSGSRWRHWISGILTADDTAAKLYRRGRRAVTGRNQPGFQAPGPRLLEAPRMVLQHFPDDHRLPQLASLFNTLPGPLEKLYRDHFGGRDMAVEHPHPVRYRPLLSAVLSQRGYRHCDGGHAGEGWHTYLKLRADDSGALRYQRQRKLCDFGGRLGLVPVTPVGFIEPLHLQVDAGVGGESLHQRLLEGRVSADDWQCLGQRLAEFHRSDAPVTARVGHDSRISRARAAANLISWAQPRLAAPLRGLISRLASSGSEPLWRPCHGDLKPEHLFFDGDRINLIDLEDLCRSDPLFDVGLLLARLEMLALTEPLDMDLASGAEALLDSYREAVPASWMVGLGRLYACAALDMARYVVQHQLDGWPLHCHYFCERAQTALDADWAFTDGLLSAAEQQAWGRQQGIELRTGSLKSE